MPHDNKYFGSFRGPLDEAVNANACRKTTWPLQQTPYRDTYGRNILADGHSLTDDAFLPFGVHDCDVNIIQGYNIEKRVYAAWISSIYFSDCSPPVALRI